MQFARFACATAVAVLLATGSDAATTGYTDAAAFNAAVASIGGLAANVVDYESQSPGGFPNGTVIGGITHSYTGLSTYQLGIRDIGGTSGTNTVGSALIGGTTVEQLGAGDVVTFGFSATNAFSLRVIAGPDFQFFAGDAVLGNGAGAATIPAGVGEAAGCTNCSSVFLGLVDPASTFTSATLTFDPDAPVSFEIDDSTYYTEVAPPPPPDPPVVPLPASLPLLLAGAGALLALRRRPRG